MWKDKEYEMYPYKGFLVKRIWKEDEEGRKREIYFKVSINGIGYLSESYKGLQNIVDGVLSCKVQGLMSIERARTTKTVAILRVVPKEEIGFSKERVYECVTDYKRLYVFESELSGFNKDKVSEVVITSENQEGICLFNERGHYSNLLHAPISKVYKNLQDKVVM